MANEEGPYRALQLRGSRTTLSFGPGPPSQTGRWQRGGSTFLSAGYTFRRLAESLDLCFATIWQVVAASRAVGYRSTAIHR